MQATQAAVLEVTTPWMCAECRGTINVFCMDVRMSIHALNFRASEGVQRDAVGQPGHSLMPNGIH